MELFTGIFYIVAAVYFFFAHMPMNTVGWCTWVYKVIPFALGLVSAFLALKSFGILALMAV